MTRPLVMTKRQAVALIKAAEAARGVVEVNPTTGVIRLIPAVLAGNVAPLTTPTEDDSLDRELADFEALHGHDRA